jgi:phage baseplate assembly protein W
VDFAFPLAIAADGRTATNATEAHVRGMIEQLLLTQAGERVNRPDFGGGLAQLLFGPTGPEMAATLQLTLQAALQRFLGDIVDVQALVVTAEDEKLLVDLRYVLRPLGTASAARIELSPGGAA